MERSPRERAQRERALNATQEWIQSANGRYEVIAHLDEIGSRHGKNWFLVNDASVSEERERERWGIQICIPYASIASPL